MQEIVKEIRDVLSEVKYPGTSKSIRCTGYGAEYKG